jgi:CheY-like chemotaxis protein
MERIPIIAMTAHALKGDRDMCLAAGMHSYISKLIHALDLLSLGCGLRGRSERLSSGIVPEIDSRETSDSALSPRA